MKLLSTLLAALIVYAGFVNINNHPQSITNTFQFQTFEPGTGNDGEDTSKRGMMCRLFGIWCSTSEN